MVRTAAGTHLVSVLHIFGDIDTAYYGGTTENLLANANLPRRIERSGDIQFGSGAELDHSDSLASMQAFALLNTTNDTPSNLSTYLSDRHDGFIAADWCQRECIGIVYVCGFGITRIEEFSRSGFHAGYLSRERRPVNMHVEDTQEYSYPHCWSVDKRCLIHRRDVSDLAVSGGHNGVTAGRDLSWWIAKKTK